MSENFDLKDIEQKAFRDTMRDGLTELSAGLLFLLAPIMNLEPSFMIFFVIFYVIFLPHALENIRQKYTYPRVGYVKTRVSTADINLKALVALLFVVIIGSITAVFVMSDDITNIYNWVTIFPFTLGLIMLGPSSYLVEKTGLKTYWLFGVFTSIFGLLVSYFSILNAFQSSYEGVAVFSMLLGAGLMVVGLITFLRFIYTNPVITALEDADSE